MFQGIIFYFSTPKSIKIAAWIKNPHRRTNEHNTTTKHLSPIFQNAKLILSINRTILVENMLK